VWHRHYMYTTYYAATALRFECRQVTSSGELIIYSGTTKTKGHRMITVRFLGDNHTVTIYTRPCGISDLSIVCLSVREKSVYPHERVYPRDWPFHTNRTRVQQQRLTIIIIILISNPAITIEAQSDRPRLYSAAQTFAESLQYYYNNNNNENNIVRRVESMLLLFLWRAGRVDNIML